MSFAPEKAQLWRYVEGILVASPLLKAKIGDSKDWIEKIYTREKKIIEF